jgi:hypothetical protein
MKRLSDPELLKTAEPLIIIINPVASEPSSQQWQLGELDRAFKILLKSLLIPLHNYIEKAYFSLALA